MLSSEIQKNTNLSELNKKASDLMLKFKSLDQNAFNREAEGILDHLEALLPSGLGITPSIFISNTEREEWKEICNKLKELNSCYPEGLGKRYYKLVIILVLYAEIQ